MNRVDLTPVKDEFELIFAVYQNKVMPKRLLIYQGLGGGLLMLTTKLRFTSEAYTKTRFRKSNFK